MEARPSGKGGPGEGYAEAWLLPRGVLAEIARGGREGVLVRYRADQSLRHIAETLGIPGCELGGAEAEGRPADLERPPPPGSRVELMPVSEPLRLAGEPRFIADVHLGRLARDLRLLGFDVAWRNDLDDEEIETIAATEGRIALTRDRGLLFRRSLALAFPGGPRGMLVRSKDPFHQLVHAVRRFGLAALMRPFSLCSACGGALEPASREAAAERVPAKVAERYSEFFRCSLCGKIFWRGDHFRTIAPLLVRLREALGSEPGDPTS